MSGIQTERFGGVWKSSLSRNGVTKPVQYGYNAPRLFCKSCANSEKDIKVVSCPFNTNEWLGERNKTAFVFAYFEKILHYIYQYEIRSRCFILYVIAFLMTL